MERECKRCKKFKPESDFYKNPKNSKTDAYCRICCCEQVLERQRKLKKMCLEYKGGKCIQCGYNKCAAALEFHHLNPEEKDFSISKLRRFSIKELLPEIKEELDKCKLLCSNCHKEEHCRLNEEKYIGIRENPTSWEKKGIKYCSLCNKVIHHSSKEFCKKCLPKGIKGRKSKIVWPSTAELKEKLLTMPYTTLAKELGVSDNAVRKRIKYHSE